MVAKLSEQSATESMRNAAAALNSFASGTFNTEAERSRVAQVAIAAAGAAGIKIPALSAFYGYSPNQFLTILLKGPKYKRVQFAWTLSPNSDKESFVLKNIIRTMNNFMAPGLVLNGALFKFPKVFQLSILPNSLYMYKFKPAILENFHINYVPAGVPAFNRRMQLGGVGEDGFLNAPVSVQISMQFMELEYWLEGDFKDTNDPGDIRSTTNGR